VFFFSVMRGTKRGEEEVFVMLVLVVCRRIGDVLQPGDYFFDLGDVRCEFGAGDSCSIS